MINTIRKNKEIIWNLSLNDFSTKYAGSIFGVFWAFFQPIVTILIYACVFQYGLKSTSPVEGVSYIFWFASGMIPWFFFSDGVRAVTNSLIEYSYLVKKVVFDVELLPVIKIVSTLLVHFVFIALLFIIGVANHEKITVYAFQLIYYLLCAVVLIYAIGQLTCSLILFFRDLGQIVNIILDVGLWATPIIWSYTIIPSKFEWIIKANPIFYITEGYRNSFINKKWFWEEPGETLFFWCFLLGILWIGNKVFNKMKPQFADVI